jgi:hypothetical protein
MVLTALHCSKNDPVPDAPPENGDSVAARAVRDMTAEFKGDNPLPRSFIGSTANISDPYQKAIAENGVITYDLAVMLKALALFPQYNRAEIEAIVGSLKNGTDIRSNPDFHYGTAIPAGHGYFYKIIDVRARWLQDQTMPVTGENAWLASAMASILKAYPATPLGQDADIILRDLAEAILALQTDEGYVRMAPKDVRNNYGGVNFNEIVSIENNISVLPVFRYMAENAASQADRSKYQTALNKLRSALLEAYNVGGKYFDTGLNLADGGRNSYFASDCQTWMILAFGVDELNAAMNAKYGLANAALDILKTTLNLAGVQENGSYIGIDFSPRKTVMCFEWTLGFISAARKVLAKTPDAQLKDATDKMAQYVESRQTDKKILKYINVDQITDTQHGWSALPMYHLASSAWNIFEVFAPEKTPFDVGN